MFAIFVLFGPPLCAFVLSFFTHSKFVRYFLMIGGGFFVAMHGFGYALHHDCNAYNDFRHSDCNIAPQFVASFYDIAIFFTFLLCCFFALPATLFALYYEMKARHFEKSEL